MKIMLQVAALFVPVLLLLRTVSGQDLKFVTDCFTPNRAVGVCIEIQNCAKLYEQVVNNNQPTFPFIRASRCGPGNEDAARPRVCCGPDIDFVQKERQCTTPNGEQASCISLFECDVLHKVLMQQENDPEQNKFLNASLCYFAPPRIPVVCCGSDTRFRNLLPDRSRCGFQSDFKVLRGEDTDISEFPWMALLEQTKASGQKSFGCGGSLINDRYVLTAAHCVATSKVTSVRLGEWDLDSEEDCVGSGSVKACSPAPQNMGVEEIIAHPNYQRSSKGVFNDIALIRLARRVTLNDFVQPICLPLPSEVSSPGQRLYVAGWGATETKRYSPKKQKLKVPIVGLSACSEKFSTQGITINEKMICAGGEKGKDSCKGDSGGPLISQTKNSSEQYYIEGIVSFGAICGTEGWPGIYTRVSNHIDWIRQNVRG